MDHSNGFWTSLVAGRPPPAPSILGVQAGQNVGVVRSGQANDYVLAGHVSFVQHLGIGDIAPEHKGPASEHLRELLGPFLAFFNDGHIKAPFDQLLGQHLAGSPATQQKCPGRHVAGQTHAGCDVAEGASLADHGQQIGLTQDPVAAGDDRVLVCVLVFPPGDRSHDEIPVRF